MAKSSKLRDETLAHYDRMIAWAERQDPYEEARSRTMQAELGESWYGFDCPLCNSTRTEKNGSSRCRLCPVGTYDQGKYAGCGDTPWLYMEKARTWKGWLRHAKAERRFLAKLPYPDEKEDTEEYCPHCDNVFDVPAYKIGQVVVCPHCNSFTVACSECSKLHSTQSEAFANCSECPAAKQAETQQEERNAENVRG